MKKLLFIVLIVCSKASYSQKIASESLDKFDSIYTISTEDKIPVGRLSGSGKYLSATINYHWFKNARYINSPQAKYFEVLIGFKSGGVTATDDKTEVKI